MFGDRTGLGTRVVNFFLANVTLSFVFIVRILDVPCLEGESCVFLRRLIFTLCPCDMRKNQNGVRYAICPFNLWKLHFLKALVITVSIASKISFLIAGCLLVHRRAWDVLDKSYFGGGTVELADSHSMHTVLRSEPQQR